MKRRFRREIVLPFATAAVALILLVTGCFGPPFPKLAERLSSTDVEERREAASRIAGRARPGDRIPPFEDLKEALPRLIEALNDPDPGVRLSMAITLGFMGEDAKDAGTVLGEKLHDSEAEVRFAAANALVRIRGRNDALLTVLAEALKYDQELPYKPSYRIRAEAAQSLQILGVDGSEAVPNLMRALEDDREDVAIWAARALASMGSEAANAVPALTGALDNADEGVVCFSANALESIGPAASQSIPKLMELMDQESEFIRANSASALGKIAIGDEATISVLTQHLRDPERLVVGSCAHALTRLGSTNEHVIRFLIEELSAENPYACIEAIESLGRMGAAAAPAIPTLTRLSSHEHEKVRAAAVKALTEIRY